MKPQEFLDLYMILAKRYPGRMEATNETAGDWYKLFKDVPASTLEDVLGRLGDFDGIDLRYPPNAYQIKAACKQAAGVLEWGAAMPDSIEDNLDALRSTYRSLCDSFYRDGVYNGKDWEDLACRFMDQDRLDGADHILEVSARIETQL
jgi:hypothetical protein